MKQNGRTIPDVLKESVCSVNISRISSDCSQNKISDHVVVEKALTIMVDKVGSFTIMCTPLDIEALAVGFVYSEGVIDSIDDVVSVSTKEGLPNVVGIQIQDPSRIAINRNLIIASSCGMCGKRNIEKILSNIPPCDTTFNISNERIIQVTEDLKSIQQLFQITGGSHAAGIFDSTGEIIVFAEDLGRHSALDKTIGKCLLEGRSTKGFGTVLTGRVSLEMVTKAAKAGIELIAAVSAPTSFAVEAAQKMNITVCGFVRPGKINIYSHPERVIDLTDGNKQ
ncbi:MAG: formate dehydrogenase accessory sulfurtransferase FdhD [Planctomycetota bacterium]|jgi:FdhD protein